MPRAQTLQDLFLAFEKLRKNLTFKIPPGHAELPSPAQVRVLFMIFENNSAEAQISIKDIAGELEISSSGATQLVDALVNTDMLIRLPSTKDRRKMVVKPSQKAQDQFKFMQTKLIQAFEQKTQHVSDIELEKLLSILNKINN